VLIAHFARDLGATGPIEAVFGPDQLAAWQKHPWPGNIRELRNAVEAAIVVGPQQPTGQHAELSPAGQILDPSGPVLPYKDQRAAVVRDFEHGYLVRLLAQAGGNVSAAARLAKMDRSHLIDLLHRHGLKS
jgi:DNA-binding NtrC family response regulator